MGFVWPIPVERVRGIAAAVFALLIVSTGAAGVEAATLDDYRRRVANAHHDAENVVSIYESGETGDEVDEYVAEAIERIRNALPETEKVEFRGGSVDTSNKWLREKLAAFRDASTVNENLTLMTEIAERLSAISVQLSELEAATDSGRSKDEDKQKLAEILSREEYQKPQEKQESVLQRWVRQFLEWLDSLLPRPKLAPGNTWGSGSLGVVLQVVLYVALIGLTGFLLIRFGPRLLRRFSERRDDDNEERVILGETVAPERKASDLFTEAEQLARSGDLRGAIRKGYIALLCELADRRMIGLARHKTNRDYLRDVRKRPGLFERMKAATASFERHWYGYRAADASDWEEFREQYRRAVGEA